MPLSPLSSIWYRFAVIAWLAFAPFASRAGNGHHMFWEVKGAHNTVYLLGSVHMLKAADSSLPPEVLAAYKRSHTLVMELNLNDAGAESLLGSGLESATLPEGQTLSTVLGSELYASYLTRAKPLGLDPDTTARFQPWFAALILEQLTLAQSGYEASAGVDAQFAQRAQADHKPIIGLETMAEQMGFFAHLTLDEQRQFLRSTLKDLDTADSDTAAVVRAWERGDVKELERLARQEFDEAPALMRQLTTERNRKWLPRIAALLNDDQDDLVIVGAMHLIGDDGLVALLKRQGSDAVQH